MIQSGSMGESALGRRRTSGVGGRLFAVLLTSLALLAGGCRFGNHLSESCSVGTEKGDAETRQWTILVYLNGDNELEAQAIRSLNQLESVELRGTGLSILALFDRSPGFDTSNGDWTGTRLFEIETDPGGENGIIVSRALDSPELGLSASVDSELDMGEPETLLRFLDFADSSYPAEHCALILWGHGSGWRSTGAGQTPASLPSRTAAVTNSVSPPPADTIRAVSFDDSSGPNPLYTKELGDALERRPVDICAFDCCSEAMLEVAYQIRKGARYMIASEDVIQSEGWDYADILPRLLASEKTTEAVIASIVGSFAERQSDTAGATISAVRLDAIEEVAEALDELSDILYSSIRDTSTQSAVRALFFQEVEDFYAIPGDLNIDLGDLACVAAQEFPALEVASERIRRAVSSAVVSEWHHPTGHPEAHGLAVHYVPLEDDGTAGVHADAYFRNLPTEYPLSFVEDSSWTPRYPNGPGLLYRIWYEVF